jgi:plastocyanin
MRARLLPIPFLAGLAVAVIPALAADQTVHATGASQFDPKTVTITQGESVTWKNDDGFHDVKLDDPVFTYPSTGPSGDHWSGSLTFNQPGTFNFYCEVHRAVGMSGTVVVEPASTTGTTPTTPTGTTPTSTTPGTTTPQAQVRDRRAPRLTVRGRGGHLRRGVVALLVEADERSTVSAAGKIKVPGRASVKLRKATRTIRANTRVTLKLKLSGSGLRRVQLALHRHAKLAARITANARDTAGNARSVRLRVALKP